MFLAIKRRECRNSVHISTKPVEMKQFIFDRLFLSR